MSDALSTVGSGRNLVPSAELMPQEEAPRSAAEKHTSYSEILKSSVLVGGSSAIGIAVRIVRTKIMAILLGPAGFGLFGLYGAIATLTQSIAEMGVNSSGVRQIAAAVGSGNEQRIAVTSLVLRRTAVVLGVLGAGFLVVFCRQISISTFGNDHHSAAVALLSLAVFFQLISEGQSALIQGTRQVFDLAKMSLLGALFGTVMGITLVYFFRDKGVVPSLVGVASMSILTSWWYSRKIRVATSSISLSEMWPEAVALLKLGIVFMASGVMLNAVAYFVRILVLHRVGLEGAGWYQSAWTLGGLYVGLIIQSMGADFYPRLTAAAQNHPVCNRLVNEQARIGLLLACPGVLATLTFTPIVVTLFYTSKFNAAVGVLRWICLGTSLQVVTWPMGFIIVAKGRRVLFFWAELACAAVYAILAWACVRWFGLNGAGIAFFAYSVFHGFLHYPIVKRLSDFRWSSANKQTALLSICMMAAVMCGFALLPVFWAVGLGIVLTVIGCAYSISILAKLISTQQLPPSLRRILVRSGLVPQDSNAVHF